MTAPSLPWHHPTLVALAKSLGVTTRTLELWRAKDAPVPATGPWDELAIRLWHLSTAAANLKKSAKLTAPTDELADYIALAQSIGAHVTAAASRSDQLIDQVKERQAKNLDLKNNKLEAAMEQQAQAIFSAELGRAAQQLRRDLAGTGLSRIWELCQQPRAKSEAALRRHLTGLIDKFIVDVLKK